MSLGYHARAEAQSRWCGASSLRKAFGPRPHGCGAVGNMLQTALQRLQVLSPAPPPTKQFRQQPRLHAQTGILQRFVSRGGNKVRSEHQCADAHHGILARSSLGPGAEQALISYHNQEVDRQAALVAKRRTLDRKRHPLEMPDLQGC